MDPLTRGGMSVSPQQAAVVDHVHEHNSTVAIAGAGAGKTRATIAAVLNEIQEAHASVDQFILITFTNEAADKLRRDLDSALAARQRSATTAEQRRFWKKQRELLGAAFIGTIHGFCARILRHHGYAERVARESGVTTSRFLLVQAVGAELDALPDAPEHPLANGSIQWQDYDLGGLAREILEHVQNRGLSLDSMLELTRLQDEDAGKPLRVALAEFIAGAGHRYEALKYDEQVLDASDLLRATAGLLSGESGPAVLRQLLDHYRYLFLDEAQDTDPMQVELFSRFREVGVRLLVVGDRKQAIYDFRGASGWVLDHVVRETGVAALPLNVSYRPTLPLLNVQNALFQVIGTRYEGLAQPLEPAGGTVQPRSGLPPLVYLSIPGPSAERTNAAANAVQRLLTRQIDDPKTGELRDMEPGDIVFLVRSNYRLQQYEIGLRAALRGTGVEVRVESGGSFYRRPEVVSTYHMLRLMMRYPDDTALSLALRTPYLQLEEGQQVAIQERELLLMQHRVLEGTPLTDWFEHYHPDVESRLAELRAATRTDTVPQLLAGLYDAFAIRQWYQTAGDIQAIENLEKLREVARRLFREEQALTLSDFIAFLRNMMLAGKTESEAVIEESDDTARPPHIRLMTVHQAKGLEFPIVIIPEIQAPLLRPDLQPRFLLDPDWGLDLDLREFNQETRSPRFEQVLGRRRGDMLAEEMRILYVAVTRAQHSVILLGGPMPRDSNCYSWQDEVLRAQNTLRPLGATFHFRRSPPPEVHQPWRT